MYNGKSACPVPGPRHDFGCPINFWQSNCYEKQSNDQNYLGGLERTRGFAILPTQTCTFEPFGFYSGEIKNWRNWSDNQNDLGGLRVGTRIYHYIQKMFTFEQFSRMKNLMKRWLVRCQRRPVSSICDQSAYLLVHMRKTFAMLNPLMGHVSIGHGIVFTHMYAQINTFT